jgi:uncharacterized protein
VILCDANVLLYAVDGTSPLHAVSRSWLERVLSGDETVAFDWQVLLAFIRISTRATVFAQPLSLDEAMDSVDAWLMQPNVMVVFPTDRHAAVMRDLLSSVGTAGNLASDAHLAALAIEHGATLYTFDRDFARFSGVRSQAPSTPT